MSNRLKQFTVAYCLGVVALIIGSELAIFFHHEISGIAIEMLGLALIVADKLDPKQQEFSDVN